MFRNCRSSGSACAAKAAAYPSGTAPSGSIPQPLPFLCIRNYNSSGQQFVLSVHSRSSSGLQPGPSPHSRNNYGQFPAPFLRSRSASGHWSAWQPSIQSRCRCKPGNSYWRSQRSPVYNSQECSSQEQYLPEYNSRECNKWGYSLPSASCKRHYIHDCVRTPLCIPPCALWHTPILCTGALC